MRLQENTSRFSMDSVRRARRQWDLLGCRADEDGAQAGDLERAKKAAIKKHPQLAEKLKDKLK